MELIFGGFEKISIFTNDCALYYSNVRIWRSSTETSNRFSLVNVLPLTTSAIYASFFPSWLVHTVNHWRKALSPRSIWTITTVPTQEISTPAPQGTNKCIWLCQFLALGSQRSQSKFLALSRSRSSLHLWAPGRPPTPSSMHVISIWVCNRCDPTQFVSRKLLLISPSTRHDNTAFYLNQ